MILEIDTLFFKFKWIITNGVSNVLLKHFLPNQHVKSILDINPNDLKEKGIKGIITDLDNTLSGMGLTRCYPECDYMV